MSDWVPAILRVYRLLLACYPPGYRAEFGGEMLEVFATALKEAHHAEEERPWRLCWREIRHWPGSVLVEHLRERRVKMPSTRFLEERPLSRTELLVAMSLLRREIL